MRLRTGWMITATAAATLLACAGSALAAGGTVVRIDEGAPLHLSGTAAQVVVGNPSIADATIVDGHQLMLLGRSYGSTNVVVFDSVGRAIYSGMVTVTSPGSNHVSLYRGTLVHNLTCGGHCERTPMPGEENQGVYSPFGQPYKDYADRAKAAAATGSGNP